MGIEVETEYNGAGSTFFSAILAVEELAKVDASVSVMCDVQNTLVIDFLRSVGSRRLREKYLPQLATSCVSQCLSFSLSLSVTHTHTHTHTHTGGH